MALIEECRIWIALLELRSCNELTNGRAFCTTLAFVRDEKHFEQLAQKTLGAMGFELISIEDLERYSDRVIEFKVSDECRRLAERTTEQQPIHFCRFHTFNDEAK